MTGIRAEDYDTYDALVDVARGEIERRTSLAEKWRLVLLVPHIPRRASPHIYAAAFDRQVFWASTDALYRRPDLKVELMIDQLLNSLQVDGYDIREQVFLEGHSIGGMFAQRYALLHPERVRAIAAQCGGSIILPERSYEGVEIPWPIGTADYASLVGHEFAQDAYRRIPQYLYTGDQDIGPTNPLEIIPGGPNSVLWDMGFDHETAKLWIQFVENAFGQTDPVKTKNQVGHLNSLGYDLITFRLYPGVGHQQTAEMLDDAIKFLDAQR